MAQAKPKETVPVQDPGTWIEPATKDYVSLDDYLETMSRNGARTIAAKSLIREEGIRYYPYTDSLGYYTIGIGHLLERQEEAHLDWMSGEEGGIHADGWTKEKCYLMLDSDLTIAIGDSLHWWSKDAIALSPQRQAVLAEMCFVLGYHGAREFHHFKEYYLQAVAGNLAGEIFESARELMDSDWHTQAPHRVERLAKRWELG